MFRVIVEDKQAHHTDEMNLMGLHIAEGCNNTAFHGE